MVASPPDDVRSLQAAVTQLLARLERLAQRDEIRESQARGELAEAVRHARQLSVALGRLHRAVAGEHGAGADPSAPPTHLPTVLLIDDEASVRRPLRLALEHCGYRVLEAADGVHGLEIFTRQREQIAVAVVDQRMPRMSGQEVLEELKRRQASLPVILISGQAGSEPLDKPGSARADAFLRKPFELLDLARTVRRVARPAASAPQP